MADLQTCYFCGAGPDATIEQHEVVPLAFEPTPSEQREVVLCPSCREKFSAIMDVVVAASTAQGELGAHQHAETGRSDTDGNGGQLDAGNESLDGPGRETSEFNGDTDETSTASGRESREPDPRRPTEEGGVDINREGGQGVPFGADAEPLNEGNESPPQRETGAASISEDVGVDRSSSETFRQVLRLLQNREFPVDRGEFAEVAASAYELSRAETEGAIQTAIRKGLLVDEDGELKRT